MQITFTTWNIYRGMRFSAVLEALKNLNSDIVALQEVSDVVVDNKKQNAAEALANTLGYSWHYCKSVAVERQGEAYEIGNALLSKLPFLRTSCIPLNNPVLYDQTVNTEPRTACTAEIQIHDTLYTVISTHIFHPHHEVPAQATSSQIESLLKGVTRNTILMGDFNNEGTSDALVPVSEQFKNAGGQSEDPTFINMKYNSDEKRRFDHIFVPYTMKVTKYNVYNSDASDHLPVTTIVEL